ncbi:uncharacterized protein FTOL_11731 [Fusarium torulosum]|uniref:Uncharacterized protein n=1 Tax=Fusarium torulosum TaxID=33205 RepID=A0AAE8SN85_9HYPO|nr:uncharacterized protein FTOL_11731 [Fusarium torulosum]
MKHILSSLDTGAFRFNCYNRAPGKKFIKKVV